MLLFLDCHQYDGTAPITHQVKEIAAETAQRTGLPVQFQDERLSTVEARAILLSEVGINH